MLKKIIAVRNVGRFINSAYIGVPSNSRIVLLLGGNGFGKTTLCTILRSCAINDPALVLGRTRLGSTSAPEVELLLENGKATFQNGTWSGVNPPDIAVFDGTFVSENVHAGDAVDIEQRRNLYRVIVGKEGVDLALEEERLAGEIRAKNGQINTAEKAVQSHVPAGIKLPDFLKLSLDAEIDTKISLQAQTVAAVKDSVALRARPKLSPIDLPKLPATFEPLLSRTLEGIAQDAHRIIAAHIERHKLGANAEGWLQEGTEHIAGGNCPYCAQPLTGIALIEAYQNVFADSYRTLKIEIEQTLSVVEAGFGGHAKSIIDGTISGNQAGAEYWGQYCHLPELPQLSGVGDATVEIGNSAIIRLKAKLLAPQEPVPSNDTFDSALKDFAAAREAVGRYNEVIGRANAEIDARKRIAAAGDLKKEEAALTLLDAQKKRHDAKVAPLCSDLLILTDEKKQLDTEKANVRSKLEQHTNRVIKPYEGRINQLLDSFNAGFRLAQTKPAYAGGVASSTYQLQINNIGVDIGDSRTPSDKPSFKNTLSAGDRSTLALAIFIAHLERDAGLANKIVVFDDPFTSQDSFRRRQTVNEIKRIADSCKQLIVFSHDAAFLRQLRDKMAIDQCTVLQLVDQRQHGVKIMPCDLDEMTRGRAASDMDDLQTFMTTGAGKTRDIIRKMRIVLETHCRATYSGSFAPDDRLGGMVEQIKKGGASHPAAAIVDELNEVNEYSREHHHGEDPQDGSSDLIDEQELTGFVKRTLRIVNNFQG